MNTQELKCFIVAADRLNFTQAAKELYVTPPTVTHHIQHLEEELGVQLFYRDSKSVQLTSAGEVFYNEAYALLQKIENLSNRLQFAKKKEQTLLRIGGSVTKDFSFLRQALTSFHKDHLEIIPKLYLNDYFQLINLLEENHLDLFLGTKAMVQDKSNMKFYSLYKCKMMALYNKEFFTKIEDPISIEQIKKYPLVLLRQKNVPKLKHDPIEQALFSKTDENLTSIQESKEAVCTLVNSGYGIGILPSYMFDHQDLIDQVECKEIKESLEIDYGIICLKKNKNQVIDDFIRCLQAIK